MNQMMPSLIRTYVPLGVSFLVGWVVSFGIPVDDSAQTALTSGIGTIVAAAYYFVARQLERRFPWATALLGSSVQPTAYAPAAETAPAAAETVDADGHPLDADADSYGRHAFNPNPPPTP